MGKPRLTREEREVFEHIKIRSTSTVRLSTGTCMLCGEPSWVEVPEEIGGKVQAYLLDRRSFGYVQDEFPQLSAAQREMLINGTHDECFHKAFPDE